VEDLQLLRDIAPINRKVIHQCALPVQAASGFANITLDRLKLACDFGWVDLRHGTRSQSAIAHDLPSTMTLQKRFEGARW
jgi:hypothetical protein